MASRNRIIARLVLGGVALALLVLAVWRLESYRTGIERVEIMAGQTPATLYRKAGEQGPLIVIAHGFAGSRQLMEAFSLSLARAGYTALAYDLQGHGRNPVPMGGDVTVIEGTTARLIAELREVIDEGRRVTGWGGPVGLVGHSMASDVVVRASLEDAGVGPVVAVSMFSGAVTEIAPPNLLVVTGAWETRLRAEALRVLQLADPDAAEGGTVSKPSLQRRAVVAPMTEHVSVLYSATTLQETRDWFNAAYRRLEVAAPVAATGGWIVVMLACVVALVWALASLVPDRRRADPVPLWAFASAALVAPLVPLLATQVELSILPVLVADYITVHLAILGLVQLAILWGAGLRPRISKAPIMGITILGIGVTAFGYLLDRYVASFALSSERLGVLMLICAGAIPFMLADSYLTQAGRAPIWRRVLLRLSFLASLALAVALDFERLMFLVIILPVIVLFFAVFGSMGRWVGLRAGPLGVGLVLGAVLSWSLAATFPLFAG